MLWAGSRSSGYPTWASDRRARARSRSPRPYAAVSQPARPCVFAGTARVYLSRRLVGDLLSRYPTWAGSGLSGYPTWTSSPPSRAVALSPRPLSAVTSAARMGSSAAVLRRRCLLPFLLYRCAHGVQFVTFVRFLCEFLHRLLFAHRSCLGNGRFGSAFRRLADFRCLHVSATVRPRRTSRFARRPLVARLSRLGSGFLG